MPDLDIQRHWKNHQVVTDDMVAELKSNLCLSDEYGLLLAERSRIIPVYRFFFLKYILHRGS